MTVRALKLLSFFILFSSLITHYPLLNTPTHAQEQPPPDTQAPSPPPTPPVPPSVPSEPPPAPSPPPAAPLPEDPLQRGQELLRRGEIQAAEESLREAVTKAPNQPEPHYFLGVILLQKGEPENAIREFQNVLAVIPNHLLSHYNIGLASIRLGKKEEAIAAFNKSLEIQPAFFPGYLELGLIYESRGEVEEAIHAFKNVIRYGGDAPAAQEAVKKARERLGQTGDTPEIARRALELFKQGQAFLDNNELKEAQSSFEEVLKIIPQNAVSRYMIAKVELEKGNIFRATRLLEEAVKFDLNAWQIYYLLGQLYESQGRWSEGALVYLVVARTITEGPINQDVRRRLATLKEIIEEQKLREEIQKDRPLAEARKRFDLGIAALQQGKTDSAIVLLKEAIQLDSNNPFYHYNLGIAFFGETRLIEAANAIQKAIELKKEFGPAHFFLGQIYVSSGDAARDAGELIGATQEYKKAMDEFDETINRGGEEWQLEQAKEKRGALEILVARVQEAHGHTILGTALSERKEKEKALSEFEQASNLVPQDPFSRLSMGTIYEELKQIEKAIEVYEAAAKASPLNPNPHIYLGQLYEKEKKIEEAARAYQQAMERSPRFVDPVIRLGTLYFDNGKFEEAKAEYLKAIQLDPKQPEPHFYLAQIYEREGKEKEAVQSYQTAQPLISQELDISRFIRDRLSALDRFSARWSHTFISYDSNVNAVSNNPAGEFSSLFSVSLNYISVRKSKISPFLPLPLTVPVEFTTGTNTYLRDSRLTNRESVSLSAQTLIANAYDLGLNYSFNFSQTDRRPTALNHFWSLTVGRNFEIPDRVAIVLNYSFLSSLVTSSNDRSSQGIGLTLNQSLKTYGDADFNYTYSEDNTIRLDQSGKNHNFSFGYVSPLFGKLRLNGGIEYSLTSFDTPRILPVQGQAAIIQTLEVNDTYTFRLGGSYPLPNGVGFSVNYRYMMNKSNLNIPRPPTNASQRELELIRPTDNFNKHLLSFSVSKSF